MKERLLGLIGRGRAQTEEEDGIFGALREQGVSGELLLRASRANSTRSPRRMEQKILTLKEVAALLRMGERTIYHLAREGRIGGAAKIGGQWRFDKAALLDWLKQGREAQVVATAVPKRRRA